MGRPPSVGVVHTAASPCRCHASIVPALRAAGVEAFEVDADVLPLHLPRLVAADAVFDQTDTVAGRGWLRGAVRTALERAGAALVGPTAAAAARADDKDAARRALAAAGLRVPEGTTLRGPRERLPHGLAGPFVVKAAHEHGSRGLVYAATRAGALAAARRLLARGRLALVERFVPGTEVSVTLVGRPPRALPPVEVRLAATDGPASMLTFGRKWTGFSGRAAPEGRLAAGTLAPVLARRLVAEARRGARALGLAGFVRFDGRVRDDGTVVWLEANPRPSLERGADAAVAAAAAGMTYDALLARLVRGARRARRAT